MKKRRPSFLPAILWLITSIVLLTLPGAAIPKANWLDKIWFDKWVHIAMFFILVVLWCLPFSVKNYRNEKKRGLFVIIAIICLSYGIGMEFVQDRFIPKRSFDTGDILADGIGCLCGCLFALGRYIKK